MTPEQELDPENWTNAVEPDEQICVRAAVELGLKQLQLVSHPEVARIRNAWVIIGFRFIHDGKLYAMLGNARDTKPKLQQLIGHLYKSGDLIDNLTPEYHNAIDGAGMAMGRAANIMGLRETLAETENAILELLANFKAVQNRPGNLTLRSAVTALVVLLEGATGVAAKASRNYHSERGHSLNSPTATALGEFLQTLSPDLTMASIVHMINETDPGADPSPSNLDNLDRACDRIALKAQEMGPG